MAETLTIRIGATPQRMLVCNPNDEENPIHVKNANFEGDVLIRVANFRGVVPEDAPGPIASIPYFNGRSRKMSFQFQGRFAQEWSADNLVWSQDWDQPLNVPTMMNLFTKFWKMTDPGSFSELNSPTPYMRSYVATAMCTITSWPCVVPASEVGEEPFRPILVENINGLLSAETIAKAQSGVGVLTAQASGLSSGDAEDGAVVASVEDDVGEGVADAEAPVVGGEVEVIGDANGKQPQQQQTLVSKFGFPRRLTNEQKQQQQAEKESKLIERIMKGGDESVKDRRRFFAVEENRKETVFKPDLVYGFEVFNPYFDPNEFKIKIPGVSIDLHKVTNGQPMRLRLMSKDGETVFFTVEVSAQPAEAPADGDKPQGRFGGLFNRFSK
ncbi:hypothetical protein BJ741DRAFT_635651 [Chytriomyces cf. hyalinus JEL632]|nr:hypothetical protein BJ741DRAFT_635651 [Chytriomyces cf. hyalinus JEL632]